MMVGNHIPLEQGLKLAFLLNQSKIVDVGNHIPLEQGLKLHNNIIK